MSLADLFNQKIYSNGVQVAGPGMPAVGAPVSNEQPTKVLPSVTWGSNTPVVSGSTGGSVVPAATLERVATPAADRQITVAAENAILRSVYGDDRIGAQIANVATLAGDWVIQAVWCDGEIDSVNDVTINDAALPSGVTATHYTGAAGQGIDATLAAAISGYADTLPGIAYSVFIIPAAAVDGMPQIAARIKGYELYDPRSTLTAWSANPALVIADFLDRAMGKTIDWASVETLANLHDATLGGVPRRRIGLTLDSAKECGQWLDVLRAYAACWVDISSGSAVLVPDAARSTDATLTHAAGQIKSLRLKKRGIRNTPTLVRIRYTDTSLTPWRDAYAESDSGETPKRESEVPLPGIHDYAQAKREAIERLNKLRLCDLSADLELFDEALQYKVGDVLAVTHPYGLSAKALRVLGISGDYGRWRLSLAEYDPAVYSDAVAAGPTFADTDLPSPLPVEIPTGVALASGNAELLRAGDGSIISRLKVTWTAPTGPWVVSAEIQTKPSAGATWTAEPLADASAGVAYVLGLEDGTSYDVRLRFKNSLPAVSDWVTESGHTLIGKTEKPSGVQNFRLSGDVLAWDAVTDADLAGYLLRFNLGSNRSWGGAVPMHEGVIVSSPYTLIARPSGAVTLLLKAIDTSGNESELPALIATDLGDPVVANVVETHDFRALGWAGTLANGSEDGGGDLVADADATPLMWRSDDSKDMWAPDGAADMWLAASYQAMSYEDGFAVVAARITLVTEIDGDYTIDYRLLGTETLWGDSTALMWSDDATTMWTLPPYQSWPGQLITGMAADVGLRVRTSDGATQGRVVQFAAQLDVEDVSETLADQAITAGGTRLALTKTYRAIKTVNLTLQTSAGTSLTAKAIDKSAALGPLIQCFDSTGTATTGTVDAIIQGY